VSHGATGARDRRGRAWAMHSGAISGDGVPSGRSHRRVQSGRNRGALGASRSQSSAIRRSTRGRAKGAIGEQSGCTRRHSVTIQCNQTLNSRARQGCNRGAIGVHSAPLGHNPVRSGAQLEGAPAGSESNRLHSGRNRGAFGAQSVRTPGQSGRSRGRAQSGRTRRHSVSISVSSAAVQVGRDPVSLGRHPGRDAVSCCMRMTCMARQASGLEGVGQVESRVAWLPIGQCNDVIVDTKH